MTLTAGVITEGNGAADVRGVSFYRESNSVPGLQVGGDTDSASTPTPPTGTR